MAETKMRKASTKAADKAPVPQLDTEVAHRLLDPFETLYLGLLRTNDPLLLERAGASSGAELYRDLKRDGRVFSVLQKRVLALVSRPWQVEAVEGDTVRGKADAAALSDILKQANFDRICKDLLEALIAGTSICEIVWTVRNGMYVVKRAPRRSLRRFVFVQQDPGQPPELHMLLRENMLTGLPLPERKFVIHRVNPEDDNPWGTGMGLQLYWAVFFKRKALISWNKLNDRVGVPTPWGQYPTSAGPREKATLFSALKAISNDGVIMTPVGSMITLLESKLAAGGITTQQALCEYMDDWIAEVVLGQEPHRQGSRAPAAAGNERSDVRMDLVQADSDLLSDTLNNTMIAWLCELNGFVPCLVSRVIKAEKDLKATAETDKIVADMGFDLDETTINARYGDGWTKKAAPHPAGDGAPAGAPAALPSSAPAPPGGAKPPAPAGAAAAAQVQFAEGALQVGQQAIDDAINAVTDAELQDAMRGVLAPLLAAIDGASSYEDALAQAEAAYPRMDKAQLQSLLARGMFGAETFGRQTND